MIRLLANTLLAKKDRFDSFIAGIASIACIKLLLETVKVGGRLQTLRDGAADVLVYIMKHIPSIHAEIETERKKARDSIHTSIIYSTPAEESVVFSIDGVDPDRLVSILRVKSEKESLNWKGGNLTGAVYSLNERLQTLHSMALGSFSKANLLHPDVFTASRQMEAEVIDITLNLYSGDSEACGSITSGGTESIILAIKGYRDRYKKRRPNIVVPSTAHAAFSKAGEYLCVEVRKARCVPDLSYEVDLGDMESLIDRNTIALVGSAPGYPHGSMDPIPAIARMAKRRGIGCHVDACLGSFLLPFLKDELPYSFDFDVEGVTSISCDTHKYAYAPKGSSVLMWRSRDLRKSQYSICTDWEGGLYATPTILGSRNSAASVGAWVTMMFFGKSGYADCAAKIKAAAQLIANTVVTELSNELCLMGRVDTSVVSFTTNSGLNIYDVADYMKTKTKRKWSLALLQSPPGVHFAVTMANADSCAEFSEDLVAAVREERQRITDGGNPGSSESAAIYGSTASVPKGLVKDLVVDYLDVCYETN
jgi:sphinganine-1-phosphate aldolase